MSISFFSLLPEKGLLSPFAELDSDRTVTDALITVVSTDLEKSLAVGADTVTHATWPRNDLTKGDPDPGEESDASALVAVDAKNCSAQ